jgi:hypothetical protein
MTETFPLLVSQEERLINTKYFLESSSSRKVQSAMRSPARLSKAELARVVEQYVHEVQRIRLRSAILQVCQAEGLPVPEGEEMEAHIDACQQYLLQMEEQHMRPEAAQSVEPDRPSVALEACNTSQIEPTTS